MRKGKAKRKYTKRKPWKSRKRHTPTKKQRIKLLLIKKLYDNYGSLQKVADDLNLTRERVRQLLIKGDYYKLYEYEPKRVQNFKKLRETISREVLIGVLRNETNKFKICEILSVKMRNLYKLIQFYDIDFEDYRQDFRQRKFLMRYSDIVNKLGHHPSTTEMNNRPDWRNTWMGIDRIWSSIENFREEFGIEKPPFNLHPNTLAAFKKGIEKRQKLKEEKILMVKALIEKQGPISANKISKSLGFNLPATLSYLNSLLEKNLINKIKKGTTRAYIAYKEENEIDQFIGN